MIGYLSSFLGTALVRSLSLTIECLLSWGNLIITFFLLKSTKKKGEILCSKNFRSIKQRPPRIRGTRSSDTSTWGVVVQLVYVSLYMPSPGLRRRMVPKREATTPEVNGLKVPVLSIMPGVKIDPVIGS